MDYHNSFLFANHCHIKKAAFDGSKWQTINEPLKYKPKKFENYYLGVPFIKRGTGLCQIALLDLDDHKGTFGWDNIKEAADKLMVACEAEGLTPHPFRSSGGKGIHLWFVWDEPQQAAGVRFVLNRVLNHAGYASGAKGVEAGQVEVFPKQDTIGEDEDGSCACLPFRPLDFMLDDYETRDYKWTVSGKMPEITAEEPKGPDVELTASQLKNILDFVPVVDIGYDEWWRCVMAIKASGGSKEMAEAWSRGDPAYADIEIPAAKWNSIKGNGRAVTGRTLMKIASSNGWRGLAADVDAFPLGLSDNGEVLLDYERIAGKGRYSGYIAATMEQVCICLNRDPEFPWFISRDDFLQDVILHCKASGESMRLRDFHYVEMRRWFDRNRWEPVSTTMMREAVDAAANANKTNIARSWAESLKWDGVDRFDDLLRAYGVPVEPYYRAVIDYAWTSQGARALHPGYQADAMIVLFSDRQGTGKTQSILAIAPKIGSIDTYMNIHIDELLTAERAARVLKGCLIANLDELRDIGSKREAAEVKAAISRTKEAFVPKYKETRDEFGRQCVIYATTNKKKFLDDSTGNRRYHILPTGDIDLDWIAANAEQLWAQGVATFKAHGQLWKRALELAVDHINEYEIDDLWEGAIAAWLETTPLEGFTTSDVLTHAINVPIERQGRRESTRVGTILKQLGYESRQFRVDGKRQRGYFPLAAADIDW